MGTDCRIMLPNNVRLQDVGELLAIFSGEKPEKQSLQGGSWSVKMNSVHYKTHDMSPTCVDIEWYQFNKAVDPHNSGNGYRYVMFHYEPDHGSHRLMMPPSTGWWLAVGKRLVDFFGGSLDYNDCDSIDVDYRRTRKLNRENSPKDNPEWEVFQTRMFNTKPITKEEVNAMVKHAAYK